MPAGARYADAAGDCTWDRQHYFSFSGGSKTSHGATKPRTAAWVGGGDGYAPALLASIARVTRLTNPLFELFGEAISARDLILLLGGLFLIWKASKEIHESIEGEEEGLKTRVSSFWAQ